MSYDRNDYRFGSGMCDYVGPSDDKAQIVASRQGTRGEVSFVAGYGLDVGASDVEFPPYLPEFLVYSSGGDEKAIQWQGSNGEVTGLWYAPNGTVDTSGSSNTTVTGGIIGCYINWSGSNVWLTGTIGGGSGSPSVQTIALVE